MNLPGTDKVRNKPFDLRIHDDQSEARFRFGDAPPNSLIIEALSERGRYHAKPKTGTFDGRISRYVDAELVDL